MATIPFTTEITQLTPSSLHLEVATLGTPLSQGEVSDSLENMITAVNYNFSATLFPNILQIGSPPYTIDLSSVVGGFGSIFGDSVYKYTGSFDDATAGDTYTSETYFLITQTIDAYIAAYPSTPSPSTERRLYLISLRQQIQTYFDAADYTNCNLYIKYTNAVIAALVDGTTYPLNYSILLTAPSEITTVIDGQYPSGPPTLTEGGWYNILKNTLTLDEFPYVFDYGIDTGSSFAIVNPTSVFADGVYSCNNSSIVTKSVFSIIVSGIYGENLKYCLVTQGIDTGIPIYLANYDVNNATEVANAAFLTTVQDNIDTAYAAEDYTLANSLILQAQLILGGGIALEMFLGLTNKANLTNFFNSGTLPSGVYSAQTGTLENTITGNIVNFPAAYPTSSSNYSIVLNSETMVNSSQYSDGVYKTVVTFIVDGTTFECTAYCLVLTRMKCVVNKLTQSSSICSYLFGNLSKLRNMLSMAQNCFDVGNYSGANKIIIKFNQETSGCNCGCK